MHTKFLLFATILLIFTSCISKQELTINSEIQELEQKKDYTTLVQKYEDYVNQYPQNKELSSRYLYRAAAIHYRSNNPKKAIELLDKALINYPKTSNTPNAIFFKGTILYERLGDRAGGTKLFLKVIKDYPNHEAAQSAKKSLPELASVKRQMKKMEEVVRYDSLKTRVSNRSMMKLVEAYEVYTLLEPTDSLAPEYLLEGAKLAQMVSHYSKAVELLQRVRDDYSNYEKMPKVLFLQGYIYENRIGDLNKTKLTYEEFLKKYPKHDLAPNIRISLEKLGSTTKE